MLPSTYSELKDAVVDWAPEISASDPIAMFIGLGEADVFPLINHYLQETTAALPLASNTLVVPDDVLELRRILVDGVVARPISFYGGELCAGEIGYSQVGNSLAFSGQSSGSHSVELTYMARPNALSDAVPVNWLIKKFPAVYLHATLARAYRWRQNPQAENGERASLKDALAAVTADHQRFVGSGNTIIMNGGNPYAG